MENEPVKIRLSGKYNLTSVDGMTIHTLLTALADAERMYRKLGMAGLAENAANAYKLIFASIGIAGEQGGASSVSHEDMQVQGILFLRGDRSGQSRLSRVQFD